jgi:hypothetical protein
MGFTKGSGLGMGMPGTGSSSRGPLERISRNLQELRENIRQTVMHEIGHYFGFDDEELRELEEEVFGSPRDGGT